MSERRSIHPNPKLAYQADPIRSSLQLLGRKWTLLIIRDIAFLKLSRFGQILRNNPGLTPRVLSRRLDEMTREGLVTKVKTSKETLGYRLTAKGEDAVYVLLAILRYGLRHGMNTKPASRLNEKEMIRELHYDVPARWSY